MWSTGKADAAYRDLRTILETSDIAVEQTMSARLQRAEWLIGSDLRPDAELDLDAILASSRNFPDVEGRARELAGLSERSPASDKVGRG